MKYADQKLEQIQKQLKLDVEKLEQRIAPWGCGCCHESQNTQGNDNCQGNENQ